MNSYYGDINNDNDTIIITISRGEKRKSTFTYNLLREPYCKKCSFPKATDKCRWHHSDTMDRTYAIGLYYPKRREAEDTLSDHIRRLKSSKFYARPLGYAMSILIKKRYQELLEIDYITPIPKHRDEYKPVGKTRGIYNQAEELADIISKEINKPKNNLLNKNKPWSQRNKGWEERQNIPDDIYSITKSKIKLEGKSIQDIQGKSILLIDDVRTSGATGSKCASLLKEAGANKVYLFVAGRDAGDQETLT
jgi:predicted amidophosphoribosyltransferase